MANSLLPNTKSHKFRRDVGIDAGNTASSERRRRVTLGLGASSAATLFAVALILMLAACSSGGSSNTTDPLAPVITSSGSANATLGVAFSYQITAANTPTSFGASGLPAGLTVNNTSGLISGTPSAAGTFNATVSATNSGGTGNAPLALTMNPPPPVVTSSSSAKATGGSLSPIRSQPPTRPPVSVLPDCLLALQ